MHILVYTFQKYYFYLNKKTNRTLLKGKHKLLNIS